MHLSGLTIVLHADGDTQGIITSHEGDLLTLVHHVDAAVIFIGGRPVLRHEHEVAKYFGLCHNLWRLIEEPEPNDGDVVLPHRAQFLLLCHHVLLHELVDAVFIVELLTV